MTLHVGTMGWSYSFWRGSFYPKDMASKDYLSYYAKRISSVEVDYTFYRIPRTETVAEWKQQTPKDFVFSLKFPQKVTHMKMLMNAQEETSVFLDRIDELSEKLGVLLLQLPPMFRQMHVPILADYLKALPKGRRFAVEVRNKSMLNEEVYRILRDSNVALVWVNAAKMPLVTEETADFLYIRWVGDRKTVTGTLGKTEVDKIPQIQEWAGRIRPYLDKGIEVFGYFSKYYSGNPTADAQLLLKSV